MTRSARLKSSKILSFLNPQTISGLLILLGCIWMMPNGDFRDSSVFRHFWIGYGLLSVGYVLTWMIRQVGAVQFWAIAILCRGILLWMYPGNDIWRYLWEGLIQTHGFSPYHLAPTAQALAELRTDWWPLINHIDVSAIYPPLAQWGFRFLAAIAPSVLLFKAAFIAADLIICYLLARRYGYRRTVDYAWNPLILYCIAGGGH